MKYVRLENNIVREIIPDEATVPSVVHWYGEDFAALCREAPDEVCQGWVYDPGAGVFNEPPPEPEPEPTPNYIEFIKGLMEGYANEQ